MNIKDSLKNLTKFEWALWLSSMAVILLAGFLSGFENPLYIVNSFVGVCSLIFISKGDVLGQILMVVFGILYAVVSFSFHYYGEMITYLFMTAPTSVIAVISWLRHPYKKAQVTVNTLGKRKTAVIFLLTAVVTIIFYFVLKWLDTANLPLSTFSIATSFLAATLSICRSPLYGVAYAANDVVLIGLWVFASIENSAYVPMIICFSVFLINDLYGFFNWRRIRKQQKVN